MEQRGAVNIYSCGSCKASCPTINLNAGTTPFVTLCPFCGKEATSSFYQLNLWFERPNWNKMTIVRCWYRPQPEKFRTLDVSTQVHVVFGGLISGDFHRVAPLVDKITEDWELEQLLIFMRETYEFTKELNEQVDWRLSVKRILSNH